ncbi:UNKNOWN [Stylonychia lemnae]|uniref:Uncharacterized protein n=1 Tax=Stylonychia lemnae TaxID=5949 RepID=A0A078AX27_STYLE|nr:UNKNOWN [Stylonychia lemnae]|eukprot:CDW86616.1 UNKNOWN [Stylonychia lemnae]
MIEEKVSQLDFTKLKRNIIQQYRPEHICEFILEIQALRSQLLGEIKDNLKNQRTMLHQSQTPGGDEETTISRSIIDQQDSGIQNSEIQLDFNEDFNYEVSVEIAEQMLRLKIAEKNKDLYTAIENKCIQIEKVMKDRISQEFKKLLSDKKLPLSKKEASQLVFQTYEIIKQTIEQEYLKQIQEMMGVEDALADNGFKQFLYGHYIYNLTQVLDEESSNSLQNLLQIMHDILYKQAIMESKNKLVCLFDNFTRDVLYPIIHEDKYLDELSIILHCLFVSNLPCSTKRFQQIKEFNQNILNHIASSQRLILADQIEAFYQQDFKLKEIKGLHETWIENLRQISDSQDTMDQLVIFTYLAGADMIDSSGDIKFQRLAPYRRDIMKRFLKSLYSKIQSEDVRVFKHQQLIQLIEQRVSFHQNQMIYPLKETSDKNEMRELFEIDYDNLDVQQLLMQIHSDQESYTQIHNRRLNLIYPNDIDALERDKVIATKAMVHLNDLIKKFEKVPVLSLKNIDQNKGFSKHIKLAVSGFLSQGDDFTEQWKGLVDYLQDYDTRSFGVQWESITISQLTTAIAKLAASIGVNLVIDLFQPRAVNLIIRLIAKLETVRKLSPIAIEINKLFNKAKQNAKVCGQMLAIFLALGHPFSTQSISLLGFSLGTQVIKSCLRLLHKLGASHIIQNVTLMGGAADFKKESQDQWAEIFNNVVNGTIKNLHTGKDIILLLFMASQNRQVIQRFLILLGYWKETILQRLQIQPKEIDERKGQLGWRQKFNLQGNGFQIQELRYK